MHDDTRLSPSVMMGGGRFISLLETAGIDFGVLVNGGRRLYTAVRSFFVVFIWTEGLGGGANAVNASSTSGDNIDAFAGSCSAWTLTLDDDVDDSCCRLASS